MQDSAVVVEAQADWLTAMFYGDRLADCARQMARGWAKGEVSLGAKATRAWVEGYELEVNGRVRFGEKRDSAIIQVSGQLADDHLEELVDVASRISRVDLAVTVRTREEDPHVAANAYLEAGWFFEKHARAAMPSRHQSATKGDTVYLGHRDSERYFRLYNKHAECEASGDAAGAEHYRNCWRYELELKRSVAPPTALALAGAPDRPAYCQEYLHDYVSGHGIVPLFPATGDRVLVPGFRRRSDLESRRAWLRSHAKPVVRFALERLGREAVLRDLGLDVEPDEEPVNGA
jgi:DNA relaxase NicK